jgi:hypothetical protein
MKDRDTQNCFYPLNVMQSFCSIWHAKKLNSGLKSKGKEVIWEKRIGESLVLKGIKRK